MTASFRHFAAAAAGLAVTALVSGCASKGELVVDDGVGITAVRTSCPAVGIPNYTGDVTLFRDGDARDVSAIDLAASMTDVRGNCDQAGQAAEEYNKRHPGAAGRLSGDRRQRRRLSCGGAAVGRLSGTTVQNKLCCETKCLIWCKFMFKEQGLTT